jgi:hypothetical protein
MRMLEEPHRQVLSAAQAASLLVTATATTRDILRYTTIFAPCRLPTFRALLHPPRTPRKSAAGERWDSAFAADYLRAAQRQVFS